MDDRITVGVSLTLYIYSKIRHHLFALCSKLSTILNRDNYILPIVLSVAYSS